MRHQLHSVLDESSGRKTDKFQSMEGLEFSRVHKTLLTTGYVLVKDRSEIHLRSMIYFFRKEGRTYTFIFKEKK